MNIKTHNDISLGKWKNQLNRRDFTSYLMIGVGHGKNSGELILLTTEQRPVKELLATLEVIKKQLECKIDTTSNKG